MGNATWSLSVEDFGPIKRASVTVAPLTIFVGQNSSGKSYMASLLWALFNVRRVILRPESTSGIAYEAAREIVQAIQQGEKNVVTRDDWIKIVAWINQILEDPSGDLLAGIFGCSECKAGSIHATLTSLPGDMPVRVTTSPPMRATKGRTSRVPQIRARRVEGVMHFTLPEVTDQSALDIDFSMLRILAGSLAPNYSGAEFLPAARTGLMLALKILVGSFLGTPRQESEDIEQLGLSQPVRDFLVSLRFSDEDHNNPHYSIAEYIERTVLKGRIDQSETGDFRYVLDGAGTALPLHVTSSLVTELVPLIVLLKREIYGPLIFEEPEAHLHLGAQRFLVCALIRLVNSGIPVLVTTHSDTFLQQINILMQIHDHPDRDALAVEFGYEPVDFLDPADARGYIFDPTDGKTVVREMTKTAEGFVEPLMNKTIADLTREILRMESG
jgi:hypothetical protein